jgi:uncharacterized membrane protein YkvA (DUF1232 family)
MGLSILNEVSGEELQTMKQSSFASRFAGRGWRPTDLLNDGARAAQLFADRRVPAYLKLILPLGALIYWIVPVDLIPGLPLDDIAVVLAAVRIFVMMAESSILKGASPGNAAGRDDQVVDTTWQVVDK